MRKFQRTYVPFAEEEWVGPYFVTAQPFSKEYGLEEHIDSIRKLFERKSIVVILRCVWRYMVTSRYPIILAQSSVPRA